MSGFPIFRMVERELGKAKGVLMTLPKNFIASVCLAVALAGVAVITAAVGQTSPSHTAGVGMSAQSQPGPSQGGGKGG